MLSWRILESLINTVVSSCESLYSEVCRNSRYLPRRLSSCAFNSINIVCMWYRTRTLCKKFVLSCRSLGGHPVLSGQFPITEIKSQINVINKICRPRLFQQIWHPTLRTDYQCMFAHLPKLYILILWVANYISLSVKRVSFILPLRSLIWLVIYVHCTFTQTVEQAGRYTIKHAQGR